MSHITESVNKFINEGSKLSGTDGLTTITMKSNRGSQLTEHRNSHLIENTNSEIGTYFMKNRKNQCTHN